jgi:hypothetical protein
VEKAGLAPHVPGGGGSHLCQRHPGKELPPSPARAFLVRFELDCSAGEGRGEGFRIQSKTILRIADIFLSKRGKDALLWHNISINLTLATQPQKG